MAPLVHMVFRQSRTLRDVIVMSCMFDLAQQDVSIALDLAVARVEGLLRAAVSDVGVGVGAGVLVLRRKVLLLLPTLLLAAWYALPLSAVAGICLLLTGLEMHVTGP